jgi:hypothetical protein
MPKSVTFILLVFSLLLFFSFEVHSQWINPKTDSILYQEKLREIEINSENKEFYSIYGAIHSCDLLFKNTDTSNYVVTYYMRKDQDFMVLF